MSGPVVSVVMATRDRPELLRRALRSVAAQSWPQVEICLVNDAGIDVGDLARAACGPVPLAYRRLRVRGGLAHARNQALRMATGTWIAYLDDDDEFLPEHLSAAMGQARAQRADACITFVESAYEQVDGPPIRRVDFGYRFDPRMLPVTNTHPVIGVIHRHPGTRGLSSEVFDAALPLMEDWDAWQRLAYQYRYRFTTLEQPTAVYHRHLAPKLTAAAPADFAACYQQITARWRPYWAPDARIDRLQDRVRAHYQRMLRAGTSNDLDTYEHFLTSLHTHLQEES